MTETIISVFSAFIGVVSLCFTFLQWRKINKKISMISNVGVAKEVLPAWFTSRMMEDQWFFGLHTVDGCVIAISRVASISDDGQWMNVELLTQAEVPQSEDSNLITAIADDRRDASVKISNIVAMYELVAS
jgi:hypothetical protein